ncbi:hypothetical protein M5D96_009647 [Drosophila gunungcola]|uniref:Uncharacterized protein n=1 Tax=Drosophila gunungcola TaxID=103775 RepID=A0A9P9YI96_9MUSC|nr:hypothetical protein M5D96_009647 [Drosophila gunungcola]
MTNNASDLVQKKKKLTMQRRILFVLAILPIIFLMIWTVLKKEEPSPAVAANDGNKTCKTNGFWSMVFDIYYYFWEDKRPIATVKPKGYFEKIWNNLNR